MTQQQQECVEYIIFSKEYIIFVFKYVQGATYE